MENQLNSGGYTYVLNGVVLEAASTIINVPAPCDPDHPEWCWTTRQLEMNRQVLMANGAWWYLDRTPVYMWDGKIQVSLRKQGSTSRVAFNVGVDDLDTPIWYLGTPWPPPAPQEPPVLEETTPPDPPAPTDPPEDPETPAEPSEPPTEG